MKRAGVEYTLALLLVTGLMAGAGALLLDRRWTGGIVAGVAAAFLIQAVIFWTLLARADAQKAGVAHAAGVLIRFVSVGLMAFLVIPALALPAAAALLSMVSCFFLTTLIEAVFLKRRYAGREAAGATTIQTEL